ncbi:hypothetical protein [Helicobacter sp. 23-1045]
MRLDSAKFIKFLCEIAESAICFRHCEIWQRQIVAIYSFIFFMDLQVWVGASHRRFVVFASLKLPRNDGEKIAESANLFI